MRRFGLKLPTPKPVEALPAAIALATRKATVAPNTLSVGVGESCGAGVSVGGGGVGVAVLLRARVGVVGMVGVDEGVGVRVGWAA